MELLLYTLYNVYLIHMLSCHKHLQIQVHAVLLCLGKPTSMFPVSVYSEVTHQVLSIQQFCPVRILRSK